MSKNPLQKLEFFFISSNTLAQSAAATERQLSLDLGAINTGIFDPTNIAIHVAQNAVKRVEEKAIPTFLAGFMNDFFRRQIPNHPYMELAGLHQNISSLTQ